jgi:aspartyl-tRNA(Asn)/glutamyl-tRNA(Gln) amidotransferase subunit B
VYDAAVITASAGAYFDAAAYARPKPDAKATASLFTKIALREQKAQPDLLLVRPGEELAAVVGLKSSGQLSSQNAEEVYARHLQTGRPVAAIVADLGLRQISDESGLRAAIEAVLAANPDAVADVRAGKTQALGFLTGQVMKETRGQANAALVGKLIREALDAS